MKQGIEFFSFDVDFFQDDKILFVSAKFGEKGENIAIKLLCKIYRNGYFLEWNDDAALLFAKSAGNYTHSLVSDVVHELVKRGFFDKSIFNSFGVLTSRGIQTRYFKACERRKEVEINQNYLLIDPRKWANIKVMPEPCKHSGQKCEHDVDILPENANIFRQSKVKESKVKESKKERGVFNASDFFEPGAATSTNQGKTKTPPPEAAIPENLQTDAFKSAWSEWQQHRKEKRNKLTPSSAAKQLKKLSEIGEQRAISAIHHSITNGWTGLFEPKESDRKAKGNWMEDLQNLDVTGGL